MNQTGGGGRTTSASSVAPSTSPPIGRRLRRRRALAATAGGLGNGGCKRRAAGATVEIALSVHACGQSALGARPRAATGLGVSIEPVRCAAGPRRSAVRRRLPDRSGRLRTRSRRTRLEAGHWHPASALPFSFLIPSQQCQIYLAGGPSPEPARPTALLSESQ